MKTPLLPYLVCIVMLGTCYVPFGHAQPPHLSTIDLDDAHWEDLPAQVQETPTSPAIKEILGSIKNLDEQEARIERLRRQIELHPGGHKPNWIKKVEKELKWGEKDILATRSHRKKVLAYFENTLLKKLRMRNH